nr:ribonucleoside-diphosphate reductase large chain [Marseillevirus sp.]
MSGIKASELFDDLSFGLNVQKSLISPMFEKIDASGEDKILKSFSEVCVFKCYMHPDYAVLAGRAEILRLREITPEKFSDVVKSNKGVFDPSYADFVLKNAEKLNSFIVEERDMKFDWMAVNTLEKSYLVKRKGYDGNLHLNERPQQLYLRVATFLCMPDLKNIRNYYNYLSKGKFTMASPTLFNAGLKKSKLSSCFLGIVPDSLGKMAQVWADIATISAGSGGVGYSITFVRHSDIGGLGQSSGAVSFLRVPNAVLGYVDQAGRRKGSGTFFLACWHVDIFDFVDAKKPGGDDLMRAREIFYAIWTSDLFMKRVRDNGQWSLFCPNEAPGLDDVYGSEFESLYEKYENEGRAKKVVKAQELWHHILVAQVEVGMPFIAYKDAICRKSNQKNFGMPHSLNLCMEICQNTSEEEIASCNLASICLPEYVDKKTGTYNLKKLWRNARKVIRILNNVVDRNCYPPEIPKIKRTNLRHRPIGLGVQGLADVFAMMGLSWLDEEAKMLNRQIFETIYHAAITESRKMSKERARFGCAIPYYETFPGSPLSKGFFSHDLWDVENIHKKTGIPFDDITIEQVKEYRKTQGIPESYCGIDWDAERTKTQRDGVYNSFMIALMPTASTAQILRNNEAFEPFTNIIGKRTVLSGTFAIVNRHFVNDMIELGIWNKKNRAICLTGKGSVQGIVCDDPSLKPSVEKIKRKYLNAFELSQKRVCELGIDRSRYVDQTSSHNCFMKNPTYQKLTSYHFYQWEEGAKTGMYYLRTSPPDVAVNLAVEEEEKECVMCSS